MIPLLLGQKEKETAVCKNIVGAIVQPIEPIKWAVDAPEIATIDEATGVLVAVAKGVVNVTASADGVTSPPLTVSVEEGGVYSIEIIEGVPELA